MENSVDRKPIHKYWDYMNNAMCDIENAAVVAINHPDVLEHLKEYGCYEETYDPAFWVIDYIEKMLKD